MELWLPLNVANISLSNPHMVTIVLHGYAPHSLPISIVPLLPLPLHLFIAEECLPTPTLPLLSNDPFTLSTYFPPIPLSGSPTPPPFSVPLDTMPKELWCVCVWVEMDMVHYTVCVTVVLFAQAGYKERSQMFVCLLRNFLHSSLGA